MFIEHTTVNLDGSLPEIPPCLYAHVTAGNGGFIHAKRPGLEVLIPRTTCLNEGLPELTPWVRIEKRVHLYMMVDVIRVCKALYPSEALFWFNWGEMWSINNMAEEDWSLHIPEQHISHSSVVPRDQYDEGGTSALIDLHSHGSFPPFFSATDDRDETGFRIYAVIGNVEKQPAIRVRVGVYANYFEIPAETIFEMPAGIIDAYTEVVHEAE